MKVRYILPILAAAVLVLPGMPVSAAQVSPITPRLAVAHFASTASSAAKTKKAPKTKKTTKKTVKKPAKKKVIAKKAAPKAKAVKKTVAKPKKKSVKKKPAVVKKKSVSAPPATGDSTGAASDGADTTSTNMIDPLQPATDISATFDPTQPAATAAELAAGGDTISASLSAPLSAVDQATQPAQSGTSTTKRFAIAGIAGSTALSLLALLKKLFLP